MNLYNDIAVMVKTVSPTLVPSRSKITNSRNKPYIQHLLATQLSPAIIINRVKHALKVQDLLAIQLSPITWQTKSLSKRKLTIFQSSRHIGDTVITKATYTRTLRVCLTRLIIIAGDNCVANKCCIYGLFLLFVILDLLRIMRKVCFRSVF
jgi:hypothetical protein